MGYTFFQNPQIFKPLKNVTRARLLSTKESIAEVLPSYHLYIYKALRLTLQMQMQTHISNFKHHRRELRQLTRNQKKMRSRCLIQVINVLSVFIFLLLLFNCLHAEGSRFLKYKDSSSSSSIEGFSIRRAYSGPSRRGRGH